MNAIRLNSIYITLKMYSKQSITISSCLKFLILPWGSQTDGQWCVVNERFLEWSNNIAWRNLVQIQALCQQATEVTD